MNCMEDVRTSPNKGKMFEDNLRSQLTNFFKAFFANHDKASVTALISFKLDEQAEDSFVKINFASTIKMEPIVNDDHTLSVQINSSHVQHEAEVVSESSAKENFIPKMQTKLFISDYEDSDDNNVHKTKEVVSAEFKNVFLTNAPFESKMIPKSDRRKSKRPQRKILEQSSQETAEFGGSIGLKIKSAKLSLENCNGLATIKKEEIENIGGFDGGAKDKPETAGSIIIGNDPKILPSILALNGISSDSSILTSALMSPSSSLTILSQNAYNILRSVGSLTVAAQPNSIPLINTCVSLANGSTQSGISNKNKGGGGVIISSSNVASISLNQPTSQTLTVSVNSSDNNSNNAAAITAAAVTTTSASQNALRSISTITSSRQSVPSQVVQAHSSKLYKCRYCCKTFNRKFCRERHERLHTGIKPYTCEICSDKFIRLEDKKRHVRSTHNGRDSSADLNNGIILSSSRSSSPDGPTTAKI